MVEQVKQSLGKVFSFALILFFVALGLIGIVLPIIPGLVFLFIAALIAARHYPAIAFMLERNRYSAQAMRYSNGFMELGWWGKTRLVFWGSIKMMVDGVDWVINLFGKGIEKLKKSAN